MYIDIHTRSAVVSLTAHLHDGLNVVCLAPAGNRRADKELYESSDAVRGRRSRDAGEVNREHRLRGEVLAVKRFEVEQHLPSRHRPW